GCAAASYDADFAPDPLLTLTKQSATSPLEDRFDRGEDAERLGASHPGDVLLRPCGGRVRTLPPAFRLNETGVDILSPQRHYYCPRPAQPLLKPSTNTSSSRSTASRRANACARRPIDWRQRVTIVCSGSCAGDIRITDPLAP